VNSGNVTEDGGPVDGSLAAAVGMTIRSLQSSENGAAVPSVPAAASPPAEATIVLEMATALKVAAGPVKVWSPRAEPFRPINPPWSFGPINPDG
jgi:hypothetical protein